MKNQDLKKKVLKICGIACPIAAVCLYILGMIFGSYAFFAFGVVCGIGGIVIGKVSGNNAVFGLCIIITLAVGLELFMRVRDGYTGSGWYYLHLLNNPKDNKWY